SCLPAPPSPSPPHFPYTTLFRSAPTRPRIDAMIRDVIADLLFARNDPTELAVEPQAQRSVKSFARRFVHQRDRSPHQPTLLQLGHVSPSPRFDRLHQRPDAEY